MEIYTVKNEDTPQSICDLYNIPLEKLIKINDLPYTDKLVTGINLLIPYYSSNKDNSPTLSENYQKKNKMRTICFFRHSNDYSRHFKYIKKLSPLITYIPIFDIKITDSANLIYNIDGRFLTFLKKNYIKPLPVITNFDESNFNTEALRNVLSNNPDKLIGNILNFCVINGFKGVFLDFHGLCKEDKDIYSDFIKKLSTRLKIRNKILGCIVPPKCSDTSENSWSEFIDYEVLGNYVDIIFLMAYGWKFENNSLKAVSPVPLTEDIIRYSISKIPIENIFVGFPMYGCDFSLSEDSTCKIISTKQAYKLAIDNQCRIFWNNYSKSSYFRYKDDNNIVHEVHFEDALSQYNKLKLLKEYNIKGIGYWMLDTKLTCTWYLLNDLFNIKKE
ncbi:Spore germination protein YaaH [Alkalithermobacter thermoalcaliphilus JW-YL-7 = DSM 7308]|uniref:Glycoside hydrolase family 18 n=1 Tax=Alkalithermobacter thermoalcaliphilus JW-YL-7 = DSM 7308 TaxID=1121328 RepID=A0A150FNY8_CLOPD|nr:glycoside hydrolase family 18 [[Clostridium] paradoxum JW-YL-7 = DSM 7308]SHK84943.1 Spore germination protein YaaH [[Clostridium] paradoxum JW-YL-7 = DSM 7308]